MRPAAAGCSLTLAGCLSDQITQQFSNIEGGRWNIDLHSSGTIGTTVTQQRLEQNLEYRAAEAGRACYDKDVVRVLTVQAVAAPAATDFHITIDDGSPEFRACVVEHISKQLRSNFSVSRKLPSGDFERYFRIDGFAEASAIVEVESAAAHEKRMREEMERMERERQPQLYRESPVVRDANAASP